VNTNSGEVNGNARKRETPFYYTRKCPGLFTVQYNPYFLEGLQFAVVTCEVYPDIIGLPVD
jgi:hypothetical protein